MKKTILALFVSLLILSCGEIPPFVDFSEPILLARDTTYITNDIPSNALKNVLLEDISGVNCNNCPKAAKIAHDIQNNNDPGRVVVMTLHPKTYPQYTAPHPDSKDTFNTQEATDIMSSLLGEPRGFPAGAVDRKLFDGFQTKLLSEYNAWPTYVNQQLALPSKADLDLTVLREGERTVIANVKTTFLEADATPVYISVFIVESHIISRQTMPAKPTDNYDYEHNSILREGVTLWSGLLLAKSVEKGRVFEKGFKFELPNRYVMENCSIVVLINKNDKQSTEVLQCIEKPIK